MDKGLAELLASFDVRKDPFSEEEISDALRALYKETTDRGEELSFAFRAERVAFMLVENYPPKAEGWGTCYGPLMVRALESGERHESPSLAEITPEVVTYWEGRASATQHPLLSLRYADLVWEFSRLVRGTSPGGDIPRQAIAATIEIAEKRHHKRNVDTKAKLARALSVALSIGDAALVEKVSSCIVAFEDEVAVDNLRGLWGFSFDLLIENSKVKLSDDQEKKIISDLEARLARVSDRTALGPFSVESAATRLARYYRRRDQLDDWRRVLITYRDAFIAASEKAGALVGENWLRKVYAVLHGYGLHAEANELQERLRRLQEASMSEMKTLSVDMEVPREDMEKYLEELVAGSSTDALLRLAGRFLPRRKDVEKELLDIARDFPSETLFPTDIKGMDGRVVAEVGSIQGDLEGRLLFQASKQLAFMSGFLRVAIDRLRSVHDLTSEQVVDHLCGSAALVRENRPFLERGIDAYLEGDHLVAAHVLIPQVEAGVRGLVVSLGGQLYRPREGGGLHLCQLDALLRDPVLESVLGPELGQDIAMYFRVLLSDQRGWNLRNVVCHGIGDISNYTRTATDRIFHALLVLAGIRPAVRGVVDGSTPPRASGVTG